MMSMEKKRILSFLTMTVCLLCFSPKALAENDLPYYDFEYIFNDDGSATVTGMNYDLKDMNLIKEIVFPETVERDGVSYTVTGVSKFDLIFYLPEVREIRIPSTYTNLEGFIVTRGETHELIGGPADYTIFIYFPSLEKIVMDRNDRYFVKDGVLFSYLPEGGVALEFYPAQHEAEEFILPDNTRELTIAGNNHLKHIRNSSELEKCDILLCHSVSLPVSVKLRELVLNETHAATEVTSESYPELLSLRARNCDNLQTVNLKNFNSVSLRENKALVNLVLEGNPDCYVVLNQLPALEEFNICDNLQSLWVNDLSNLKKLTVSPGNAKYLMSGNSLLQRGESTLIGKQERLELVYFPEGLARTLEDYIVPQEVGMIRCLPDVKNISVPGNELEYFGDDTRIMGNYQFLFTWESRLETLNFGECKNCFFNFEKLAFGYCKNLKKVVFPSEPYRTIMSKSEMLTETFLIGTFLCGSWDYYRGTVEYSPYLESIEIPGIDYNMATSPLQIFGYNAKKYDEEVEVINGTMKNGIVMPNIKTLVISRQSEGFKSGSLDLREYGIGIELLQPVGELDCFRNSSVTKVEISSAIDVITESAFENASMLAQIELPWSTKEVESKAFSGCSALKVICVNAEVPPVVAADAFDGVNKEDCKLIVPMGCLSKYKKADVWKEFLNVEMNGLLGVADINDCSAVVTVLSGQPGVKICTTPDSGAAMVYSLDGKRVARVEAGCEEFVSLPKGFYIVKSGKDSTKIKI